MRGSSSLRLAILSALAVAAVLPARAGALALQPVGGSFDAPIYATAPAGDSRLFVVERPGTIAIVQNGVQLPQKFLDISALTTTDSERGLLSIAFDPDFARNGYFYVDYTGDGTDSGDTVGDIHVDRFKAGPDPNVADPASRANVFVVHRPSVGAGNHNGGQLQFGPDGRLYVSVGDGGTGGATAQDPANLNGKILRVAPQPGAQPEVWSLGLRNPFRFSFDHTLGDMVIGDVGETQHEEIDFAPLSAGLGKGADYGWPCREGFSAGPSNCSGTFTDPVFDYPHSDPGGDAAHGSAIIGGFVYRGSDIPGLVGRYLYADLDTSDLRSIDLSAGGASGDRGEGAIGANPNGFGQDSRCELYVAAGSQVSKIVSAPGAQPSGGGCQRAALKLTLTAAKKRVRRGKRAKLTAVAEPCVAGGEPILLLGGRQKHKKGRSAAVRTRRTTRIRKGLGPDCRAEFKVKLRRKMKFHVEMDPTDAHSGAESGRVRIRIKH